MSGKRELRSQLVNLESKRERLERSLVQLHKALSQARSQASVIEHQPQMSNQQMVDAASTPKQRAQHLQSQINEMQKLIQECNAETDDIRKKLRGE